MPLFVVWGKAVCTVGATIDAPDEETALAEVRAEEYQVNQYMGNGGYNKLIGFDREHLSIEPPEEIEWTNAEPG